MNLPLYGMKVLIASTTIQKLINWNDYNSRGAYREQPQDP